MKKIIFALLLLVSLGATAQSDGRNAIKINPLSLIFATGNISYERAIADRQSLQVGMYISGANLDDVNYSGIGITPEYRFYFAGDREAMNGVYVAPFLRMQYFRLKNEQTNEKNTYTSFGGGATLGWEKAWSSGFVLDLFAGPAYNSGNLKNDANKDDFDLSFGIDGVGLRAGIALGFAF